MSLNYSGYLRATNPTRTLSFENELDKDYYIDFSSVRGGQAIEKLKNYIKGLSNESTRRLFTGHIGCGKSTELRKLGNDLQNEKFHVIYVSAAKGLESMENVEVSDVLLTIAQQVSENLENVQIDLEFKGFKGFLKRAADILLTEIEVQKFGIKVPGNGEASISSSGEFSVNIGIAQLTAKAKQDENFRDKLKNYMAGRSPDILKEINEGLLKPAVQELVSKHGKEGLVILVDGLDLLANTSRATGTSQQEHLFVDKQDYLKLHCHVIYTMPLRLTFSNSLTKLDEYYGRSIVLPMVPLALKSGEEYPRGIELMYQLALARAFPKEPKETLTSLLHKVFESQESLNRLCRASGGHVRRFLVLLHEWVIEDGVLPLSSKGLEGIIQENSSRIVAGIDPDEWALLMEVYQTKKAPGNKYQSLIHDMFIYQYYERNNSTWFDVNPLIVESHDFKEQINQLNVGGS